jgi:hypothetical protein
MHDDGVIPTADIHLAYRVVDALRDHVDGDDVASGLLLATAELLRLAYRARTLHDPMAGQVTLDGV